MLKMEKEMAIHDLIPWGRKNNLTPVEARENNVHPLMSLQRDVNRLFDEVFRGFGVPALSGGFGGGFGSGIDWPNVEIKESDKELQIYAELPGLSEKDVEIIVNDGELTLRGERRSETEDKERGYSERYYGHFERHIGLPRGIERDKASATFKDGVLTVALPKSQAAIENTRRIPINAN
jgi:HSP20 family protein